jgi:hypothetical protein
MEATTDRFQLEAQIQRDSLMEELQGKLIRSQHTSTKLIKALVAANESILTAAATAEESDKILAISKDIAKVLGEIALP